MPEPDSAQWWQEVAQGLGVSVFDARRELEQLRLERDSYRSALLALLPLCDGDSSQIAQNVRRCVRKVVK